MKLADNTIMLQVAVLTDITARKSTAEAMHLCDKALAATSEATLITDCSKPDNPIIYCNEGFTKLFGMPPPPPPPPPPQICSILTPFMHTPALLYCPCNMTWA